jgi:hypothetical protein
VAARIARWIDDGLGAHEVAVVFAGDDPETRRCVRQALDDARIPWSDARAEGLLASPVARALLALPKMVARGADREEALAMQRDPLVVRTFSLRYLLAQREVMTASPRNRPVLMCGAGAGMPMNSA